MNERLLKLERDGDIGLTRGTVSLAPHNPRWKRLFSDEAYVVFDALKIDGLRLYHIGSTSIPGISAKPVIDVLGSAPSLKFLDERRSSLEAIGYEYKGEYGIPGRRYCVLYDSKKQKAFIHLHIFEQGNPQIESHLLFRDYLRRNPSAAQMYDAAKSDLIRQNVPRETYSDLKSPVISRLTTEAQQSATAAKTIVAILGTAEGGHHTADFLAEHLRAAQTPITIDLNERTVGPFTYDRRKHAPQDTYLQIVDQMIEAELIVLATPVYWYSMSGAMKDFMDRFSDLLSGDLKLKGEALYGKKIMLLSSGYDEELPHGFEVPFAGTAIYFGMDYLGAKYRSVR